MSRTDDAYDDEVVAFYRKYMAAVRGYLINMGTDRGLADEIVDDAFLAARRRWAQVRILDRPEAYVFKIARNERSKRQKSLYRREEPHPEPEPPRGQVIADHGPAMLDKVTLQRALPLLPSRVREVIVLRFIADLTIDQTAVLVCCSAGRRHSPWRRAIPTSSSTVPTGNIFLRCT